MSDVNGHGKRPFIDPWGYKGISLDLIAEMVGPWGCDSILFFNYERVNMGLANPAVSGNIEALLGVATYGRLRSAILSASPIDREALIVDAMCQALSETERSGRRYVLPFCFMEADGSRTSHHLIFVSKHPLGYDIMKQIMARESSKTQTPVPTFIYCPAHENAPFLFNLSRLPEDLPAQLLDRFAGRRIKMRAVYEAHNVGTRYIKKNYKDALMELEEAGLIEADPPAEKRRRGTFSDKVLVTFPPKAET